MVAFGWQPNKIQKLLRKGKGRIVLYLPRKYGKTTLFNYLKEVSKFMTLKSYPVFVRIMDELNHLSFIQLPDIMKIHCEKCGKEIGSVKEKYPVLTIRTDRDLEKERQTGKLENFMELIISCPDCGTTRPRTDPSFF
jgi:hypothetical protein